jgi:phage FluMu protein Com
MDGVGMSEYKCPKCGGELERVTNDLKGRPAFEDIRGCRACRKVYAQAYLSGYWTRDREEKEKRCATCAVDDGDKICPIWDEAVGFVGVPEGDFCCNLWEPK